MSTHVLRRKLDSNELLERILNKSALTTKRVGHSHILALGDDLLSKTYVDVDAMKEAAVRQALAVAERRHEKEMRDAIAKQRKELEDDKILSMESQKKYYEDLAERVAVQRDQAEKEHMRQLAKLHEQTKQEALRLQWQQCEVLKQEAIAESNIAVEKKLRVEFNMEKKAAINEALSEAEKMFAIREEKLIADTTVKCAAKAAEEAAIVAKKHTKDIEQHQHRYGLLKQRYHEELDHRQAVDKDFRDLQDDYKRFLDYTDGKYHSDYMIQIRDHGSRLARKQHSLVQYEEIKQIQ